MRILVLCGLFLLISKNFLLATNTNPIDPSGDLLLNNLALGIEHTKVTDKAYNPDPSSGLVEETVSDQNLHDSGIKKTLQVETDEDRKKKQIKADKEVADKAVEEYKKTIETKDEIKTEEKPADKDETVKKTSDIKKEEEKPADNIKTSQSPTEIKKINIIDTSPKNNDVEEQKGGFMQNVMKFFSDDGISAIDIETKEEFVAIQKSKDLHNNKVRISKKQSMGMELPRPSKMRVENWNNQILPSSIGKKVYKKLNAHLSPIEFKEEYLANMMICLEKNCHINSLRSILKKIDGRDIDITIENGNTALMLATYNNNYDMIMLLISHGASLNKKNHFGFAPIHLASANGDEISAMIMIRSGVDVNMMDDSGNTPLMHAVASGNLSLVKRLIDEGAIMTARNKKDQDILDFASISDNKDIIHYLVAKGDGIMQRGPVTLDFIPNREEWEYEHSTKSVVIYPQVISDNSSY